MSNSLSVRKSVDDRAVLLVLILGCTSILTMAFIPSARAAYDCHVSGDNCYADTVGGIWYCYPDSSSTIWCQGGSCLGKCPANGYSCPGTSLRCYLTAVGCTCKVQLCYCSTTQSVGGIVVPVDKFGLLAPYIGLASTILVAAVATAVYVKRVKRRKEKQ